jgi:hypothetical protein
MTTVQESTPLRDALYAFSLAKSVPDADLLDEFTRRYPEHAAALTEFAIDLAVNALRDADEEAADSLPDSEATSLSPVVSRAISAFQNRLFELGDAEASETATVPSSPPPNPFTDLDRAAFQAVAEALNANRFFVVKLRDRQIDPKTMTSGFQSLLSSTMHVPIELLAAHFAGAPQVGAQLYKADDKPSVGGQQSFEEAVRGSGLTETQQEFLLKL